MKKHICFLAFIMSLAMASNVFAKNEKTLPKEEYYKKMFMVKDLIADVLPPPAYIIESYLTTIVIVDKVDKALEDKIIDSKESKNINNSIEYLRQLKEGVIGRDNIEGYFERMKIWTKELNDSDESEKQIKKLMLETSFASAKEFYSLCDSKFIPAIKSGNLEVAKKTRLELKEIYNRHRKAIDDVVNLAKNDISKHEISLLDKETSPALKKTDYNKIMLMKDLVSDIFPPTCFIIESYLLSWEMIFDRESVKSYSESKERVRVLETTYNSRYDYWQKKLESKKLKKELLGTPYKSGKKFYKIYNDDFLPLLESNNLIGAKKIMREKLVPVFEEHFQGIDGVVVEADMEAIQLEKDALTLKIKK